MNYLDKLELDKDQHIQASLECFLEYYARFLDNIIDNLSEILKIIIKFVYYSVMDIYKTEHNNYHSIFTILIFGFLISPKMQDIYNISQFNYLPIKDLNRIVRVSLFLM